MRNTNKKGFTIVELVVVVAVIAILAAVLIPTFSGIIAKANQSADQQAVTNMNKILKMEEASGNKPETAIKALELLRENGYNYSMKPYYDGYTLAWLSSKNAVVLVKDNAVVYPKEYAGVKEYNLFIAVENDPAKLQAAIADLKPGEVLVITEDMKATDTVAFNFSEEKTGSFGLDLNGNKLTSTAPIKGESTTGEPFDNVVKVSDGNVVTLSNGTIKADGPSKTCLYAQDSTVTLNNMELDNTGKSDTCAIFWNGIYTVSNSEFKASGNAVQGCASYNNDADETTVVLNNVTAISENKDPKDYLNSAIGLEGHTGSAVSVIVNGGTYEGKYFVSTFGSAGDCNLTINDGTFEGGICDTIRSLNLIINGGTFNTDDETSIAKIQAAVQPGCTITINGESYSNN